MGSVQVSIIDSSDPGDIGTTWRTDEDGTHHTVADLTISYASEVNRNRCTLWHDPSADAWSGADWSNAMCGEAGELANVVKKLRRHETRTSPPGDPSRGELMSQLEDAIADVFCYLDLVAAHYDIDLATAIVSKFNRVSERSGFPHRLP